MYIYVFFFFLLNLLEWLWLTKLYRFQVHSSTAHHLYTVVCSPVTTQVKSLSIGADPLDTFLHSPIYVIKWSDWYIIAVQYGFLDIT